MKRAQYFKCNAVQTQCPPIKFKENIQNLVTYFQPILYSSWTSLLKMTPELSKDLDLFSTAMPSAQPLSLSPLSLLSLYPVWWARLLKRKKADLSQTGSWDFPPFFPCRNRWRFMLNTISTIHCQCRLTFPTCVKPNQSLMNTLGAVWTRFYPSRSCPTGTQRQQAFPLLLN